MFTNITERTITGIIFSFQKQKKTPRRTFSEGQITRRMNPTRNARPPEKFALEKFTVSAVKFAEQFRNYRQQNLLKKRLSVVFARL